MNDILITQDKGFYTNSFHVNVDAGLSIYEKIDLEAPFHKLCNGGSITYIELASAPLDNWQALNDAKLYQVPHCHEINRDLCHAAGFPDYGLPVEFLEADMKRTEIL